MKIFLMNFFFMKKITNKQKRLIIYIFWSIVLAIGWYFFMEYDRRILLDKEIIKEIRTDLETKTKFYLNVKINGNFSSISDQNLRKSLNSIFQNPKLNSKTFFYRYS